MFKRLLKSKTAWTAVAGIVAAASAYFTGDIDAQAALQAVFTGLIGLFIRDGIAKNGAK